MTTAGAGAAGGGRFTEALRGIPLVTLALLATCVTVFVADNLGSFYENVALFALSPSAVVERAQLWRVVTGAFLHGGLLHIGMNMMSLLGLGSALEPMFGSFYFACTQAVYVLGVGGLYVALCYAGALVLPGYQHTSAVGFSGVLFAMAMDEVSLSPFPSRSVFGLFSVPTALYPWVLMGLLQFLLPNVSLVGHLAGIFVGLAHARGWLKWALPSLATVRRWEGSPALARLVRLPGYRLAPQSEVLREGAHTALGGGAAVAWARAALRPVTDCLRLGGGGGGPRGSAAAGGGSSSSSGSSSSPPAVAGAATGRMVVVDGRLVPAAGSSSSTRAVAAAATAPPLPASAAAPSAPPPQQHTLAYTQAVKPPTAPPAEVDVEAAAAAGAAAPPPGAPAASSAAARAGLAALARLTGAQGAAGYAKVSSSEGPTEEAKGASSVR